MFFFEMRKRNKKRGGLRFPPHHPKRPLAELWQGGGSTRTTNKKRFAQIGSKPFLFYSCPRGSINTKQCQV